MAWVVEAKEYGVVITLPLSPIASMTHSSALCPFTKSAMSSTPRYFSSSSSSWWCLAPMFVSMWVSHKEAISFVYSSSVGMEERVTQMGVLDIKNSRHCVQAACANCRYRPYYHKPLA